MLLQVGQNKRHHLIGHAQMNNPGIFWICINGLVLYEATESAEQVSRCCPGRVRIIPIASIYTVLGHVFSIASGLLIFVDACDGIIYFYQSAEMTVIRTFLWRATLGSLKSLICPSFMQIGRTILHHRIQGQTIHSPWCIKSVCIIK